MNNVLQTELRQLLMTFVQCLTSCHADFTSLNCKSPQSGITSIAFKLEKLADCARSIQNICQSLKKEPIGCLPCLNRAVDKRPPKNEQP